MAIPSLLASMVAFKADAERSDCRGFRSEIYFQNEMVQIEARSLANRNARAVRSHQRK